MTQSYQNLIATVRADLAARRFTFTEAEALKSVWEAGYEIVPENLSLVEARPADTKTPSHWMMPSQTLANNLIFDRLQAGEWDGTNLVGELERLSTKDNNYYIFCPADTRFAVSQTGRYEIAAREVTLPLPPEVATELDALAASLFSQWAAQASEPLTHNQVVDLLQTLGWATAANPRAWNFARSWLLGRSEVLRVASDLWMLATAVPSQPSRSNLRLRVLPVRQVATASSSTQTPLNLPATTPTASAAPATAAASAKQNSDDDVTTPVEFLASAASALPVSLAGGINEGRNIPAAARWTDTLRTKHILQGFLRIPARAITVYPHRVEGGEKLSLLRGLWFSDNSRLWVWLDRENHRLFGPALAEQLSWCETGQRVEITLSGQEVGFRLTDCDQEVQNEETRLLDLEALAALRLDIGESYRQSIQAILLENPTGLPFSELVKRLRERQQHDVLRASVRAILHGAGFRCQNNLWFALPAAPAAQTLPLPISEVAAKQLHAERTRQALAGNAATEAISSWQADSAKELALLLLDSQSQVLVEKEQEEKEEQEFTTHSSNNLLSTSKVAQLESLPSLEKLRRRAKAIWLNLAQISEEIF